MEKAPSFFGEGTEAFEPLRLTCDHAASSYGIPVLVDAQGCAYGPDDVIPFPLIPCRAGDWVDAFGLNDPPVVGWPKSPARLAYEAARNFQMDCI